MEHLSLPDGQGSDLPVIKLAALPPASAPLPRGKFRSIEIITRLVQFVLVIHFGLVFFAALMCFQCRSMMLEIDALQREIRDAQPVRRPAGAAFRRDPRSDRRDHLIRRLESSQIARQIVGGPVNQTLSAIVLLAVVGWVYRASSNLPALQGAGLTRSPAVAAILLLIPGVNLVASLLVLNQIALGSDPRRWSRYGINQGGLNQLVFYWWLLHLVIGICTVYVLFAVMPRQNTKPEMLRVLAVQGVLLLTSTLPLALGWWMFGSIHSDQEKRAKLVESK